jgi:glucose/arabinose dehydrogenase
VSVVVFGDTIDEGDEHLMLELQNASNATLTGGAGVGTIVNDDPSSGLESRPTNLSCIAPDKPTVNTSIDHIEAFAGAGAFAQPVALLLAPDDPSQWYVVEQGGSVFRFANHPGVNSRNLFIDISDRANASFNDSGLLAMAFHPDYATNRFVYVYYTATGPDGTYELTSRLSRFESLDDGLTLDPDSEVILMSQDQPFRNHNGGHIAFGPDGFLYFGLGDGGSSGGPGNQAQNNKNLFGALMRVDVDAMQHMTSRGQSLAMKCACAISAPGIDAADGVLKSCLGIAQPVAVELRRGNRPSVAADVGQGAHEGGSHRTGR